MTGAKLSGGNCIFEDTEIILPNAKTGFERT